MVLHKTGLVLLAAALLVSAQTHSFTKSDVDAGRRIYQASCIGCHGSDGSSVSGIDLGHGKFKRAVSDEDLAKIIVNGVPGTGMPPTSLFPSRVYMLISFLRNMSDLSGQKSIAAATGDVVRGKMLFETKAGCNGCHRIWGQGGRSGPDLSEAGIQFRPIEVEIALLEPDATYPAGSPPFRIVRKSGEAVLGFLLNQDSYSVQFQDDKGNLHSYLRGDLLEAGPVKSWMPSYRGKLDAQELADIIAYVGSQRGAK